MPIRVNRAYQLYNLLKIRALILNNWLKSSFNRFENNPIRWRNPYNALSRLQCQHHLSVLFLTPVSWNIKKRLLLRQRRLPDQAPLMRIDSPDPGYVFAITHSIIFCSSSIATFDSLVRPTLIMSICASILYISSSCLTALTTDGYNG